MLPMRSARDTAADLPQRQPNGKGVIVVSMKLKLSYAVIDKGVDAGLSFKGKAPDLGGFEFGVLQ